MHHVHQTYRYAVGAKALAEIEAEIAQLEREFADLKARKPDAVRAVIVEASSGYVADLAVSADELRQLLVTLSALDKITARETGEWQPNARVVLTLPALAGVPEQPVIAPASAIAKATEVWRHFAEQLGKDALADVESLVFPHVVGNEDSGKTIYSELSSVERRMVDLEHASLGSQQ